MMTFPVQAQIRTARLIGQKTQYFLPQTHHCFWFTGCKGRLIELFKSKNTSGAFLVDGNGCSVKQHDAKIHGISCSPPHEISRHHKIKWNQTIVKFVSIRNVSYNGPRVSKSGSVTKRNVRSSQEEKWRQVLRRNVRLKLEELCNSPAYYQGEGIILALLDVLCKAFFPHLVVNYNVVDIYGTPDEPDRERFVVLATLELLLENDPREVLEVASGEGYGKHKAMNAAGLNLMGRILTSKY